MNTTNPTRIYSVLAAAYDQVMSHVDYAEWAAYVQDLLLLFHPEAHSIYEIGCGTGSLAFELQPLGEFEYVATDGSNDMIAVARRKARLARSPIRFDVADFTSFVAPKPSDVVIQLFDGLNYLTDPKEILVMMRRVHEALAPGGVFLFDQSTPANSINNEEFFEDEGHAGSIHYVRHSWYDPAERLHTTTFDFEIDGRQFHEKHVQRAYDLQEIRTLIEGLPFEILAAYEGFSDVPATAESERIQWVVRRA